MTAPLSLSATVRARWAQLSRREQIMVSAAGTVLALTLTWSLAVKPALSTLRTASADRQAAQATLERLQSLAQEADTLRRSAAVADAQSGPERAVPSGIDDATRSLLIAALGIGTQVEAQGRTVTVTFEGASAEQLRQALRTLRSRLRARLIEAELKSAPSGVRGRLQFEWTTV